MNLSSFDRWHKLSQVLPRFARNNIRSIYWNLFWESERKLQVERIGELAKANLRGSERATLVEAVNEFYPFSSILEIGSGYGQLLSILARQYSAVEMLGIDRDEERVTAGNMALAKQRASNGRLAHQSTDNLAQYEKQSFDLVIASAVLLYVGPGNIIDVLRQMLRIARKGVILLEQDHPQDSLGELVHSSPEELPYYKRNYTALLRYIEPEATIESRQIAAPIWETEEWRQFGKVIVLPRSRHGA